MATSYLSPGVYVEEVDRGTKPLEMVGTSTVGFIGECDIGPVNEPIFCTNWSQFTKNYGDFQNSEYLAHAVYGFFNNGGGRWCPPVYLPQLSQGQWRRKRLRLYRS